MKIEQIKNKQNAIDFMSKINYAKNFVSYETDEAREQILTNIKIVNEILGSGAIEELPATIEDWNSGTIDGVFNILCRVKESEIPQLSLDSWNVFEIVEIAKTEARKSLFSIDHRLFKLCRKLAYQNGMKFKTSADGCYFSSSGLKESVFDKIQSAYRRGDASMSFSMLDYNVNTIRKYASDLSIVNNQKFRCSSEGTTMIVYFREPSADERFKTSLLKLKNEFSQLLTDATMKLVVGDVFLINELISDEVGFIEPEHRIQMEDFGVVNDSVDETEYQSTTDWDAIAKEIDQKNAERDAEFSKSIVYDPNDDF